MTIEGNDVKLNSILEQLRDHPIVKMNNFDYFTCLDGVRIFYHTWKPTGNIKKILVIAHGMAGHGEFFVLLADKLVDNGVMVIAPDYRNYGNSDGKKGDLKKFKSILKDFNEFINFIKKSHPSISVFLCGESMGGAVSINFARDFPETFSLLSGLILFAPGVKLNMPKSFWIGIGIISPLILFARLFFPSRRIIPAKGREDQGIKNPLHQKYDQEDPLHLDKVSIRYLIQVFKYIRKAKKCASKISIPTIIFQGTEDSGISPEGVKEFFSEIPLDDKKLFLIEGGYHALMTDPSFQESWPTLVDWIKNH